MDILLENVDSSQRMATPVSTFNIREVTTNTFSMVHRPAPSFIHLSSFLAAPGIVGLFLMSMKWYLG